MSLKEYYESEQAAADDLRAAGYILRDSGYFAKRGFTHGWTPYESVSLARVHCYAVTNGPNHYCIKFY